MKRVLAGLLALVVCGVPATVRAVVPSDGSLGLMVGDKVSDLRSRFGDPALRTDADGGQDVRYVLPALNLELDIEERSGFVAAYEIGPWRWESSKTMPSFANRQVIPTTVTIRRFTIAHVTDGYGVTLWETKDALITLLGTPTSISLDKAKNRETLAYRIREDDVTYGLWAGRRVFSARAGASQARRDAFAQHPLPVDAPDGRTVEQAVWIRQPGRAEATIAEQVWATTNLCDGKGLERQEAAAITVGGRSIERVAYACRAGDGLTPMAFFDLTGVDLTR